VNNLNQQVNEPIYTEDHLEIQRTLRKIIDQDINPYIDEWEEAGIFPAHELFKKLGNAGLLGANKPVEYGGLGLDYSYNVAIAEELGTIHNGSIPMAVGVQMDMATPALARFGSDELRKEFLAPAIAGDAVTCIGVSEPSGGSDVSAIRTTARRDGDDYVINGSKMWITNGTQADWMCCLANTGDGPIHQNKSLIILPLDTKGVTVEKKLDKLGMRASDTAVFHFDDVRVPVKNLIGKENMGFQYQMIQFQEERLYAVATSIKGLEAVINEAVEYTMQRKVFGKPLIANQVIQFKFAELQTEIELLRSLLYRAVQLYNQGEDVTKLASMAKLKAGKLCREVTDACLQYYGGMGFTNEMRVSRAYRDMRVMSIGGGADEVMLGIISKMILPNPKK